MGLRVADHPRLRLGLLESFAYGPYQGKETGESNLSGQLFDFIQPGDVILGDKYSCSYWDISQILKRGAHAAVKRRSKPYDRLARGRPVSPNPLTPKLRGIRRPKTASRELQLPEKKSKQAPVLPPLRELTLAARGYANKRRFSQSASRRL